MLTKRKVGGFCKKEGNLCWYCSNIATCEKCGHEIENECDDYIPDYTLGQVADVLGVQRATFYGKKKAELTEIAEKQGYKVRWTTDGRKDLVKMVLFKEVRK